MSKPKAVLCSDIHYNLNTLELADKAMRQAIGKANSLEVPLIVAGDLHDTKANLRGECVNAMIETFKLCRQKPYIIRGNHDQINEKSEDHSLNFLKSYAIIIETALNLPGIGILLPYYSDPEILKKILNSVPKSSTLVMHQGIQGSNSGEYIQDKSAINPEDVAGFRVISGHYHTRQTIKLPNGGVWNYIGNPYTLNYAEANDPEKGFRILMDDGSLEFIPTNLRKHIVLNVEKAKNNSWQITGKNSIKDINSDDLVKVKVTGTREDLAGKTKETWAKILKIKVPFKLDLIPTTEEVNTLTLKTNKSDLLDALCDATDYTKEGKARLKQTWRDLHDNA